MFITLRASAQPLIAIRASREIPTICQPITRGGPPGVNSVRGIVGTTAIRDADFWLGIAWPK
jgi:hypothetical protein